MYVCSCPVRSHPEELESIYVVVVVIAIGTTPEQGNLSPIFPVTSLERDSHYMGRVALTCANQGGDSWGDMSIQGTRLERDQSEL